jgi:hypothetical protein
MSLRLLGFLGHRITTDRVLVATARAEELADAGPSAGHSRLRGEGASLSWCSPLSRPDTASLCGVSPWLASHTPARLEEQAWATSAGNPFVIVETCGRQA